MITQNRPDRDSSRSHEDDALGGRPHVWIDKYGSYWECSNEKTYEDVHEHVTFEFVPCSSGLLSKVLMRNFV